ncbi:MAG: kinase/pyrophosphorylase [Proteobacteria bacterium]|nr:kinase/pyrophosphorylase [Pseudomonadota bacterium]
MTVPKPLPVFILSDGTGITGESVVRAAFRQFKGHLVHLKVFPHVTEIDDITALFRKARHVGALVVTTLVTREMRKAAEHHAKEMGIRHLDLLGHLIHELEGFLNQESVGVPGTLHTTDDSYFRRIEAVEFTVKLDDGKLPRMLSQADLILVGVSRTSKTPLSTFLAHKGFKVANVPIVLDRPPPKELFEVDQDRIFALTIDPSILQEIRLSRLATLGMGPNTNYGDRDYILAEIEYADDLFAGNPDWPVLSVTNKAVEETAARILRIFQDRGHVVPMGEVSQL